MDFQKVRLKEPLTIHDGNRRYRTWADTDNDGIYDRYELGDDESDGVSDGNMKIKVDITGFIKKAVEKELYGNDTKAIRENQAHIKDVIAEVKYNIYKNRYEFDIDNVDNNKMNWKEEYEHNLNVDADTQQALGTLATKDEKINYLKVAPSKLMIELWKYKSNPTLKDTDFDGIDDGFGYRLDENGNELTDETGERIPVNLNVSNDKRPLSNRFKGIMNSTKLSNDDGIEVDMTMDYRYFLMNNQNYYDELSTMSLLFANSIYMNDSGVRVEDLNNEKVNNKYKNLRIKDLMEFYGFKNVKTYYLGEDSGASDGSDENRGYRDTHKSRVAIGYKNIEYHGIEKAVVGIVIRGTAEDDDWDSDFDMGDIDLLKAIQDDTEPGHENIDENISRINTYLNNNNTKYDSQYNNQLVHFVYGYPDWTHRYHHAGFDIVANRIIEIIGEYMNHETRGMNDEYSFWITGHSMGAGVANIVAAELLHGSSGINNRTDNVYCYTFAAPNTFYYTDNVKERDSRVFDGLTVRDYYREPKGNKYRCIFNIVNDDDFVPKLPMEECQWTKYGRTARVSIEKEIKPRLNNFIGPIQSGKYRNFIQNDYRSNKFAVDLVISLLQGVYDYQYSAPGDKNHMRNETYSYSSRLTLSGNTTYSQNEINKLNEDISYMDIQTLDDFVFEYSKPYQKNNENLFGYSQKQTPAFLMQSIAGAMHSKINVEGEKREQGEENTFLGFKVKDNQYRFIKTKMAYSGIGAKWSILLSGGPLNALETPHYLESYYTLTKELSIVDFR